jgi:cyclic di-GMP phosphodiesterase
MMAELTANPYPPEPVHVLIVDDEPYIRELLVTALSSDRFYCMTACNGAEALETLRSIQVDIIITDIEMPEMGGLELLKAAKELYDVDVIVMTAHADKYTYKEIIKERAADFVHKPIPPQELVVRLEKAKQERDIRVERDQAHQSLRQAHKSLKEAYLDTVHRLVLAAEFKDENTGNHLVRIQRYCELLAQKYAEKHDLSPDLARFIRYAAPMHDIGKIGIQEGMLHKPGKLTNAEFEVMKTHTTIGGAILEGSSSEVLQLGREVALSHHERWNGSGYPNGLSGTDIPLAGRIVGLADVYDALRTSRPYKDAYPVEATIDIIRQESGTHFDPELVDLLIENLDGIMEIEREVGNADGVAIEEFEWSERDRERNVNSVDYLASSS